MTLNDIIELTGANPSILLLIFTIFPGIAFVLPMIHRRTIMAMSPWRYVYTILIYLVAFPGILSFVLVGYALFFTKSNLMNVNILVYFLLVVFYFYENFLNLQDLLKCHLTLLLVPAMFLV